MSRCNPARWWRWWTSRLRYVADRESFIRLYPNPGFSVRFWGCRRWHWCQHYGWHRVEEG